MRQRLHNEAKYEVWTVQTTNLGYHNSEFVTTSASVVFRIGFHYKANELQIIATIVLRFICDCDTYFSNLIKVEPARAGYGVRGVHTGPRGPCLYKWLLSEILSNIIEPGRLELHASYRNLITILKFCLR